MDMGRYSLFITILCIIMNGCIVRRALYPAPADIVPLRPPKPYEALNLPATRSNSVINAWHSHNSALGDSMPVVLFLHGNGENIETLRKYGTLSLLHSLKCHFIVIDYPGYGRSTGSPSEASLVDGCETTLKWIDKRYPENPLIIVGWSLGASVAILAASRNTDIVDGLVAMSAWTNVTEIAARFYPHWLVKLFLRDRYNSLEAVKKTTCPVLFIHGEQDGLIPVSHGERLSSAAPSLYKWRPIRNAEHNDLLDQPEVWDEIKLFLASITSNNR